MNETLTQILTWLSLFVGVASLVLSCYTIWLARFTESETRLAFQRNEDRMREHYEKTKDVLAEIDKRAAVIDNTIQQSQQHLLQTVTTLLNETVIPKKPDMGEQLGMKFMESMMQDPKQMPKMLEMVKTLGALGAQQSKQT